MKKKLFITTVCLFFMINKGVSQLQCKLDSVYLYDMFTSQQGNMNEKRFYTYNSAGQCADMLLLKRNTNDTSQWVNNYQMYYTYNSAGDTLTMLFKTWSNNSVWLNSGVDTFNYSNGKIISVIKHEYDQSTMSWKPFPVSQTTYTYNGVGNVVHKLIKEGTGFNNLFYDKNQYFYTYNSSGKLSSSVWQSYNPNIPTWSNILTLVYGYNNNGQQDTTLWSSFNVVTQKTFFTFDTLQNPIVMYAQGWNSNDSTFSPTIVKFANYFYSCKDTSTVGVEENQIQNIEVKVYPNPANEIINVEFEMQNENAELKITDVSGRVLKQSSLDKNKNEINVSELSSGIYFLQLFEKGTLLAVKKMVKE